MKMCRTLLYIMMSLTVLPVVAQDAVRVAKGAVVVENLNVSRAEGNIVVDLDLNLDGLDLGANNRFVFTPSVVGQGNTQFLAPLVVNGRRQDISYKRYRNKLYPEQTVATRRRNGTRQSIHYTGVLPYEDWMDNSNVLIDEELYKCCCLVLDQQTTVLQRRRKYASAYIRPDKMPKERHVNGRAFLDFPVDKITLYPDYRNNPRELDSIYRTINTVKMDKNTTITHISIHGYASPESPYEHNAYLAENRARTLKEHVCRYMQLDESLFEVKFTPEDWEGLRAYVSESNLTHRAEILEWIDRDMDPDEKERAIKTRYPEDYSFMLQTWYPALRHSDYEVTYVVRPFTVEEAKELLYTKPQLLSLEEMFMVAQTYEPGSDKFNEVFEIAVRMFPTDSVANLNVACVMVESGNYERAQAYLKKAGNLPEVLNARGVIAAKCGREAEARQCFKEALRKGVEEAGENLKLMDME